MQERKAAPVALQTVFEVQPIADFVYGFVARKALEKCRRRIPRDLAEFEKPDIEPRRQNLAQIVVDSRECRIAIDDAQQIGAQIDQELHAARDAVELREESDPRRLQ